MKITPETPLTVVLKEALTKGKWMHDPQCPPRERRRTQRQYRYAFDEIQRRFASWTQNFVYAKIEDWHEAEDISQEIFTLIYFKLTQLQSPYGFTSWFRTLVRHECYHWIRRIRWKTVDIEAAAFVRDPAPPVGHELEVREQIEIVKRLLPFLPFEQERAIELHYLQGLSLAECQKELKIKETALLNRISRGLEFIRHALEWEKDFPNGFGKLDWEKQNKRSRGHNTYKPYLPKKPAATSAPSTVPVEREASTGNAKVEQTPEHAAKLARLREQAALRRKKEPKIFGVRMRLGE